MSFASPMWLLALAVIPLAVVAYLLARRRTRRYVVRFPATATVRAALGGRPSYQTYLPAALMLASLAVLAIALARPQVRTRVAVDEGSLVLVTDHSGSMAATDVRPTRLAAAVSAANTFIDQLPSVVRLGAVTFSSSPDAVQQPVANHAAARSIIDAQSASGGTNTGEALQLALELLKGSDPKHPPSAIVLLSDGAANEGPDPVSVAQQAGHDRIPIYTVALGTAAGVLPGPFGGVQSVPPDPQLMQAIARVSGARAFNAQSADELSSIYKHLGHELGTVAHKHQITAEFALAGVILLLGAAAASVRWSGRLP